MMKYNGNVILLLMSTFITTMGVGITQMYSLIYIYSLTNSNFYAALQGTVIFGSGIIASTIYFRNNKKRNLLQYMLICELICFLAVISIACLQILMLMYIVLIIVYIAEGFFKPSYQAMLYRVTNDQHITQINASSSILYSISLACGWLIAPICFDIVNYQGLFFFDAMTYLISYTLLLFLKVRLAKQNISCYDKSVCKQKNIENDLSMKKSFRDPTTFHNMLLLVLSILIMRASIDALEMGIFKSIYNLSNMLIGLFFTLWMLGNALAGIASWFISNNGYKKANILRLNSLALITTTYIFVFCNNKYCGMLLYTICGFLYIFSQIFADNYIYKNVSLNMHARCFSLKNIIINSTMLVCLPLLGFIADKTSILISVYIAASLSILVLILEKIGFVKMFFTTQTLSQEK